LPDYRTPDEANKLTGATIDLPAGQFAQADFRSGQVGQNGHELARLFDRFANGCQSGFVLPALAVGHVQSEDVHAGGN
jgi:hypothetical protein